MADDKTLKETITLKTFANREARKKRIPVSGANRDILTVRNKEPGYVYRFVNVVNERIHRFMDAGYEFVSKAQAGNIGDPRVDSSEGTSSYVEKGVGMGQKAVLMRIPEEFYKEDQLAKQRRVDEIEATMKRDAKRDRYGKLDITSNNKETPS